MFHIARLNFTLLLCVHKGKFAAIVLSCFFPMFRKMGVGFAIVGYSLLGENKIYYYSIENSILQHDLLLYNINMWCLHSPPFPSLFFVKLSCN
jgi:hypothetical protein